MQLESLDIQGFKSFPDAIHIDFHPGVTAIVGPNGSGKSNVTDAIRWVLGEQSAKSLRGSKMEDVIFNGTQERRRLASAEVSVTFSNHERELPLDYETVCVTRRYYRSGESDYLINGSSCRLKDVHELFADTGIGRDGYSIIGQGKVDEILSERSDDRRRVFDEAAGIVKFKMRKAEAERKFDGSQQNLARVSDILEELEGRLEPLEEQAGLARRFDELSGRVRELDLGLTLLELSSADDAALAQLQLADDFLAELSQVKQEAEGLQHERSALEERRQALDLKLEEQERQQLNLNAELARYAEEASVAREQERQQRQRLEELAREKSEAETRLEQNRRERGGREENLQRLREKQENWVQEVEAVRKKAVEAAEKLSQGEQAELQRQAAVEEIGDRLFELRHELLQKRTLRDQRIQEQESSEREQASLDENAREASRRRQEAASARAAEETKSAAALASLREAEKAVTEGKTLLDQAEKTYANLVAESRQTAYQLETLKRLEENREGYHPGIREIAKAGRHNPKLAEGLKGTVAELIRVDAAYETAVEMCLGSSLQNLVTESKTDASRLIQWLKNEKAGRETFLPLDHIEERSLNRDERRMFERESGFLGSLDEFMAADPAYSGLLAHLGGRVLLADSMASALWLSELSGKRLRVVTLGGEVINPGGSMTGGSSKRGLSGLLSRGREIDQQEKRLKELETASQKQEKVIQQLKEQLLRLGEKENRLSEDHLELEKELFRLQEQEKQLGEEEKRYLAARDDLGGRREAAAKEEKELGEALEKLNVTIETLDEERRKTREVIQCEEQSQRDIRQESENLHQRRSELEARLEALNETLKGMTDLRDMLEQENQRLENLLKHGAEEESSIQTRLAELKEAMENREASAGKGREALRESELLRQQLREERLQGETAQRTLFGRSEMLARRESELEQKAAQAQAEAERIREKNAEEKNRIWEAYQISFHQAEALGIVIDNRTKASRELRQLRQELRAMPPVNHSAPQEFEELSSRVRFLRNQKADIVAGGRELERVIAELEVSMRELFQTQLEEINQRFQKSFSELFSGGHAELQAGEGDLLDCPILIKAQPPGKRLQSLSLLSGGERALTAIALVFAIFALRPAPFCVLDEVESALDDANVLRFTDYVKAYANNVQFILVTHRKGTMEAAERLYGITMKERGVSKLLSLRMGEEEPHHEGA